MDAEEIKLKRRIAEEELNSAYRKVFGKSKRSIAQKRVIEDFEAILKAPVFLPDKNGHYDHIRAAVEDGSRKLITDILKRINSVADKFDSEDEKGKPTVNK